MVCQPSREIPGRKTSVTGAVDRRGENANDVPQRGQSDAERLFHATMQGVRTAQPDAALWRGGESRRQTLQWHPVRDYSRPMSEAQQPLSAIIITMNAASQLQACLESVAFCDEIVAVNSGSADGTTELAGRYGARVIHVEWRGFGPQKQLAVEQANNGWVLVREPGASFSEDGDY